MKNTLTLLWVLGLALGLIYGRVEAQQLPIALKSPIALTSSVIKIPSQSPDKPEMFFQTASTFACIAASPDGKWIIAGGSDYFRVWNTKTNKFDTLVQLKAECREVTWSADSQRFAIALGGKVAIFDVESHAQLAVLPVAASKIAWSPDGKWLVIATQEPANKLQLWDMSQYVAIRSWQGHTDSITAFSWSPDGTVLATGSEDKSIRIWSIPDGTLTHTLGDNPFAIRALAWSPDGQHLLSAMSKDWDNTHFVWNTKNWNVEHTAPIDHWLMPKAVGFLPDNRTFYVDSSTPDVKVWSLDSLKPLRTIDDSSGKASALLPDGKTLLRAGIHGLRNCDLATGKTTEMVPKSLYANIQLTQDGKRLLSFYRGNKEGDNDERSVGALWDTETMRPIRVFSTPANQVKMSPDGSRIVEADKEGITIWDVQNNVKIAYWPVGMWDFEISANGQILAGWNETQSTAYFWDLTDGHELHRFPITIGAGEDNGSHNLQISPDSRTFLLTHSLALSFRLFDVSTGRERGQLEYSAQLRRQAPKTYFTPDNKFIFGVDASSADNLKLWDVQSGKLVRTLGTYEGAYGSSLAADGRTAVISKDCYDYQTWDLATLQKLPNNLFGATFSADSSRYYTFDPTDVFAKGGDLAILVSDAKTRRPLTASYVFPPQGESAAWLTRVADGSYDCSSDAAQWFGWQTKDGYKTAEEMQGKYLRPDLVRAALQEPPQAKPEPKKPSAKPVQPTQNSPRFTLRPGEIALSGRVVAVNEVAHTLTLLAERFTLPSGKTSAIAPAKNKTVRWTQPAANTLQNQRVTVVGTDSGAGNLLTARIITPNNGN